MHGRKVEFPKPLKPPFACGPNQLLPWGVDRDSGVVRPDVDLDVLQSLELRSRNAAWKPDVRLARFFKTKQVIALVCTGTS